jgi:hypothetical protein
MMARRQAPVIQPTEARAQLAGIDVIDANELCSVTLRAAWVRMRR